MLTNIKNNPLTIAYRLANPGDRDRINSLAELFGVDFVLQDSSREFVIEDENLPVLKIVKNQLRIEHQGQLLFFHPSMSLLRMISIRRGQGDRFLAATGLQQGDCFLDATMGLASDTLIAAWAVGERGKVVALESSVLIEILVYDGLQQLGRRKPSVQKSGEKQEAWQHLTQAASRIEIVGCNHLDYLQRLPDASFDIVYFDPMFRHTIQSSSAMKPLKTMSHPEPISPQTIEEACRVARKRVVLKERREGGEFERLGFTIADGSRYNPICYGTIAL